MSARRLVVILGLLVLPLTARLLEVLVIPEPCDVVSRCADHPTTAMEAP